MAHGRSIRSRTRVRGSWPGPGRPAPAWPGRREALGRGDREPEHDDDDGERHVRGRALPNTDERDDDTRDVHPDPRPLVPTLPITPSLRATPALLLGRQAAAESSAAVLLTESDTQRAGLAALTGHATPHSLETLASQRADDHVPTETFAELEPGLRLVAATPRQRTPAQPDALNALLGEARDAHGLVVVDCGTNWSATSPVHERATHVIWTLSATPVGLARALLLFESDVLPPPGRVPEIVVATAREPRAGASVRALRRLAARRAERLVLIPHSAVLARGETDLDEPIKRALTGLASSLRKGR